MRKIILTMLVALGFVLGATAQERTISGKVTDEKGAPIEGVSVTSSDNKNGTKTDASGNYTVKVSAAAKTITFSNVNFDAQRIKIGTGNSINVLMNSKINKLDEIVVVGYGGARKKIDEVGAISSIKSAQIENLPSVSLDKALQGKAAGVLVQANNGIPGGNINVRIRGEGSINAGNQPLYVIDGVQFNTRNDAAFTQSNPLAFLNPNDIESIDIIKDAASAAIYGSTASNGVVLVTTKKGRAGKTRFGFNVSYGLVQPLKKLDVLNSQEIYQLRSEAVGNSNNLPASNLAVKRNVLGGFRVTGAATFTDAQSDSAAAALPTYDWQNEMLRTGQLRTMELTASGGNEKMTFRVAGSGEYQETFVTKADFERMGLKIDLTNKFTSKLNFNTSLNVSTFKQNNPFATDGSFLGSAAFSAPAIFPMNPIRNQDGSYYGVPGAPVASLIGTLNQNIAQVTDFNSGYTRSNQLVGYVSADYKINKILSAKVFAGLDYRVVQGKNVRDPRTPDGFGRKGIVSVQSNWNTNINSYATLNYNQVVNDKHRLDGLIGVEMRKENNESISATGDGFATPALQTLNAAANPFSVGEFFTGFRRNGVFGNFNYNYDRRYLIGVTGRYDGSSRFGDGFKFGTFYGIKFGWNIDQEKFLKNSKYISQMRLRYGYGVVGNDQIGNFDALGLYGSGSLYNGNAGLRFTQLANPNLRWEKVSTSNFGIDFGFINNRINGSVEWYTKKTDDLLLDQPLQLSTGFASFSSNIGKLQNKGFELTLNADVVKAKKSGGFSWSTTFIFGINKQSVTELYGGLKILPSSTTAVNNANNSIQVGQSVGVLYTQEYAGVNAATGRPMWYDSLGNITYQVQARDRRIIGQTNLPKYSGGFTNTFSWKGFSISAFFNYEYGRIAQDGQVNFLSESLARINNLQYIHDGRWTAPGQITSIPRMNAVTETKSSGGQSGSRTWFKADYIRLKTFTLAYDLPVSNSLIKSAKISNARFYVQGTNLWTYSDTQGYDIEFVGTATGIIPQSRVATVGLQISF